MTAHDDIDARVHIDIRAGSSIASPMPALFLDRDGVIVEHVPYLKRVDEVRLRPGIADLIAAARTAQVPVCVVTNQAGIDRRLFAWDDYFAVEREIDAQLESHGLCVDAVAACPFHPQHSLDYAPRMEWWRKPGPGMLLTIARRLQLNLARSWLVGDNATDIAAARKAGLMGAVLVQSSVAGEHVRPSLALAAVDFRVAAVQTIEEALDAIRSGGLFRHGEA